MTDKDESLRRFAEQMKAEAVVVQIDVGRQTGEQEGVLELLDLTSEHTWMLDLADGHTDSGLS